MFHLVLCAASAFAFVHAAAASPTAENDAATAEREIANLKAEQRRLLDQIKRELASSPANPSSSASGPLSSRERSDRRAQLTLLLAELERRVNAESSVRTRYVTSTIEEPAIRAYYDRLQRRVEQQGNSTFPRSHGASLYGRVIVVLTLTSAGRVESIEIAKSTSDELAKHSVKLLKQLAPFERFPPEVAKSVDRMVITAPFTYSHE